MIAIITKEGFGRTLVRMAAGAAFGAGATMLFFEIFGERAIDMGDGPTALAVAAGLIYGLLGLFVGLGVIIPSLGARMLNVESADELREQRRTLAYSAAACLLVGLLLLVLAASTSGSVNSEVAAVIVGLSLVGIIVASVRMRPGIDELMQKISTESSALALYATIVLIGGWAALAHLGFVGWIEPLALIAALALIELAAIFWVSGRRGLLKDAKRVSSRG